MTHARTVRGLRVVLPAVACMAVDCGPRREDPPEQVLLQWAALASRTGNQPAVRREVYQRLSARARARLAARAMRATELTGRTLEPWEMLAPGRFRLRFQLDPDAVTARVRGDHAVVVARGRARDEVAEVPMVLEEGRWRIDLDVPALEVPGAVVDGGGP